MCKGIIAVAMGIALSAAPGAAQTVHMHDHGKIPERQAGDGMMQGIMAECPFLRTSAAGGGMMGSGLMGMDHGGGVGGKVRGMGSGPLANHRRMDGWASGPQALLERRDELGLSDAQVSNLEKLRDRADGAVKTHLELAVTAGKDAVENLNQDSSADDRYRESIRTAAGHISDAHITLTRSGMEARLLLTSAQRNAVWGASGEMHRQHGEERMGGSGGHPCRTTLDG